MRGLTGLGLVWFHPNIIILWLGIIGLGMGTCDVITYANCYVGSVISFAYLASVL